MEILYTAFQKKIFVENFYTFVHKGVRNGSPQIGVIVSKFKQN